MDMQGNPQKRARHGKSKKEKSTLSSVIRQNIREIVRHRNEVRHNRSLQMRIADTVTVFAGSMTFVYVHIFWFGAWFLINSGWLGLKPFDPFPYGLLTMIVSLEAIFLSTFVLVSQNRMSRDNDEREQLDLQVNLLTERELTRVLLMLDQIEKKLGIETKVDAELADFEKEIQPEEILKEIERNQEDL